MESVEQFTLNLIEEYLKGPPNEEFEDSMIKTLFQDQNYDLILSVLKQGFKLTPEIEGLILKSGYLPLYQYLQTFNFVFTEDHISPATKSGNLDTLQWLISLNLNFKLSVIKNKAIKYGHLEILEWITPLWKENLSQQTVSEIRDLFNLVFPMMGISSPTEIRSIFSSEDMVLAIKFNQFKVVKWLHDKIGAPTRIIFEEAVLIGNLEILQWLKDNDYPVGVSVDIIAAINGQVTSLQWLKDNNYELSPQLVIKAVAAGHLNVLQWTRDHCIEVLNRDDIIFERIYIEAVLNGHLNILKWLKSMEIPWTPTDSNIKFCSKRLIAYDRMDILQWLQENNYRWRIKMPGFVRG